MKTNISARIVLAAIIMIWLLLLLPYFVPSFNKVTPIILGLPFVVFWQYVLIFAHVVCILFCAKKVWDPFDREEGEL